MMESGRGNLDLNLVRCIEAFSGEDLADTYVTDLGQSVLELERKFNNAAGFTAKDDRLQKFFTEEKFGPGAFVFDVPEEELDSVHKS